MRMRHFLTLAAVCAAALLGACAEEAENQSDLTGLCGNGEDIEVEGAQFCVFSQEIIEEGFRCPDERPQQHDFEGFTACGPEGDGDLPEDFEERAREEAGLMPRPDIDPEPDTAFRFVLVEDLTANPSGDFPGADIDAVSVIKANGDEFFATAFEEDTDISCEGNLSCDITGLLGVPDAINGGVCFGGGTPDASLFTALNGGFVIVQFSSVANGDVTIENGDDIHIYEIGASECGRFDDDPFRVSVSVADDVTGDFKELGEGGSGSNIVPVSGL